MHHEVGDSPPVELRQSSEVLYRELAEAAPDALFVVAVDGPDAGRILDVNERAARIHGYTREELLQMRMADLDVPEDAARVQTRLARLLADGELRFRVRHRRRDGSDFPVEVSARLATLHGRRCSVAFNRDVSDGEFAEELLREQDLCLGLSARAGNIGFWDWDMTSGRVYFSPEWKAQLGYERHEIGDGYHEWETRVHPDDLASATAAIRAHRCGERPFYESEFRMRHRDGTWRWIHARGEALRDAAGNAARMVGCHVDITERKLHELQLRAAEASAHACAARLQAIYDSEPECIATLAPDGRLLEVNPAGLRMLEVAGTAAVVGRPLVDFVVEADRAAFLGLHRGATAGGSGCLEFRLRGQEGAEIWVEAHAVPLRAADGVVDSVLVVLRDVSARRRAEAERAALTRQLVQLQRTEAIGSLAGGIAHDFNNVLAAISGNLELAMLEVVPGTAIEHNLGEIRRAADRACGLVRQILAFSRSQEPGRAAVPLAPVVAEVQRFLRATLAKSIAIEVTVPSALPCVLADAGQVHQVLMNLGTNAAHAIGDLPGRIHFALSTATLDTAGAAALRAGLPAGDYVEIAVSDTGCGMDSATRARIFEPFFTTKAPGKGTGLGLSVVQGIVLGHGGAIAAASAPGQGTTMRVWLPVASTRPAEEPTVALPAPGRGEHVLLLDDEPALLRATASNLERAGYRVSAFARPEQAVRALGAQPHAFDVVVTDQEMPGMPGTAVAQRMRAVQPDVPIVLCSGYLPPEVQARVEAAGILHQLIKPFTTAELSERIRRVLHEARPVPMAVPEARRP